MYRNINNLKWIAFLYVLGVMSSGVAEGHDTWVQVNSPRQEVGQPVFVEFCLGNHANEHRDYRLASRLSSLNDCQIVVHTASGPVKSLNSAMHGFGTAEKEGPWIGSWTPEEAGRYFVESRLDIVKGTIRARQISRAFFEAAPVSTDRYTPPSADFPIDLIPVSDTLQATEGEELVFHVIFQGKPQPNARVSLLPLGVTLKEGFDEQFERLSDEAGIVKFTPETANRYLVVTKRIDDVENLAGIERLAYTASCTLVVRAPINVNANRDQPRP